MDRSPIILEALYENDALMAGPCTEKAMNNFRARLRRRGFKLSPYKQAYYHPTHWDPNGDPGDTWLYEDGFTCKTPEARAWLKAVEEGT